MLRKSRFFSWALLLAAMPFLLVNIYAQNNDEQPENGGRVARVSFLNGEAQIRRAGRDEWERVVSNLPLVEGDEIATDPRARLEIQFDRDKYLRLDENSYLKIVTLRDEGIAAALSQGTLGLRLLELTAADGYFEIDAPATTVAFKAAGSYRMDAGDDRSEFVRIAATDGGEARIYSANDGFTLRDGRSATISISGRNAGELAMANAANISDDFDIWVADRQETIDRRLRDADYGTYYTKDFYGAEDLDEYGSWTNTSEYGYIWSPSRGAVSSYSNWSPYRYGSWRWLPDYGWTWVNDESWGWATYHHGRWVYYNNRWGWSPYGAHRSSRSWWRPALVVFASWGNNVCWYPLSYYNNYYNYYNYTTIINHTTIINNPSPTPTPTPNTPIVRNPRDHQPPLGGVVWTAKDEFGTGKGEHGSPPIKTAGDIIKQTTDRTPKIDLPDIKQVDRKADNRVIAKTPPLTKIEPPARVGAAVRQPDKSVDTTLKTTRIFGGRQPSVVPDRQPDATRDTTVKPPAPRVGVFERNNPRTDSETTRPPVRPLPPRDNPTVRPERDQRTPDPVRPPTPRNNPRVEDTTVKPPSPRVERQPDPVRPPTPRQPAPPPNVTPRPETPRQPSPPPAVQPRQPTPRPPAKVEPPSDVNPAPAPRPPGRKDG